MREMVNDDFGMFAAKRLGDVATPADRPVGGQDLLQILDGDVAPRNSFALLVDEGGRMVMPMDFPERLLAIGARLTRIPLINDGRDQASLRRLFDLRQTFLAAGFLFRPTRALTQPNVGSANGSLQGGFAGGDAHARGLVCLRTGDNSLSAEFQIGAQGAYEFKH